MKKFRNLRADEIECRIQSFTKDGKSFRMLLYKNARCDMKILDETVGAMNWQRHHSRDNANCTVSIWDDDKKQWVEKEDTGTESYTEAEKGLASDSFKRACFNWGIGIELYTAPEIWVDSANCKVKPKGNGFACYDTFKVTELKTDDDKNILHVVVKDITTGKVVFPSGRYAPKPKKDEDDMKRLATEQEKEMFFDRCKQLGVDYRNVGKQVGATSMATMTAEQHGKALIVLKEIEEMDNGQ